MSERGWRRNRPNARWHFGFKHHALITALDDEQLIPLLQLCWDAPEPRSTDELSA
jgi:hypothetical protein